MIAETANLATGLNVVKRPLLGKLSVCGVLNKERRLAAGVTSRNAKAIIEAIDMRHPFHMINREQSGRKRCLTDWRYGKQRWTPLAVLPARGSSE